MCTSRLRRELHRTTEAVEGFFPGHVDVRFRPGGSNGCRKTAEVGFPARLVPVRYVCFA
jgi:hypothetical protein